MKLEPNLEWADIQKPPMKRKDKSTGFVISVEIFALNILSCQFLVSSENSILTSFNYVTNSFKIIGFDHRTVFEHFFQAVLISGFLLSPFHSLKVTIAFDKRNISFLGFFAKIRDGLLEHINLTEVKNLDKKKLDKLMEYLLTVDNGQATFESTFLRITI